MFSRRFRWNLQPNRFSLLLEEKKRAGQRLLDLTESNPTRVGLQYARNEILRALSSGGFDYEPSATGLDAAREAICRYYRDHSIEVTPDQLLITTSTSEGYGYLFKLLADPEDEILVPAPSYPLLDFLSAFEGVNLATYRLEYDHLGGWSLDIDSLEDAVTSRTRAIVVVSPNNPTGTFLSADERATLVRVCNRCNLVLIVDEVFLDYGPLDSHSFADETRCLTFVLSGLSKVCGLPQMKLGWILTVSKEGYSREARDKLELISDTYLSVSTPVQHAAPMWLEMRHLVQDQIRRRVQSNLQVLSQLVHNTACRLLKSEGGWYSVVEVPRNVSEEELTLSLLEDDDVVVHPGYFFDFPREAFVVLSLLTPPDAFNEGVRRIINRF